MYCEFLRVAGGIHSPVEIGRLFEGVRVEGARVPGSKGTLPGWREEALIMERAVR